MRFPPLTVIACVVAAVSAQANSGSNPNPFKVPEGFMLTAGQPSTIQWTPTTQGPVTLTLRDGAASNLDKGTVIISSDSDPNQVNYTPQFVVESSNTVASMTDSSVDASSMMSASASSIVSASVSSMASATASMMSATFTMSGQSTMASVSARSATTGTTSSDSSSSISRSSTGAATTGAPTTDAQAQASSAPTSGASVRNLLNMQGGMAAMLFGVVAVF
ncbi:MAG: hypothetical protein Q9217_003865 [Psora testacea]